jgi:hypothetical protein
MFACFCVLGCTLLLGDLKLSSKRDMPSFDIKPGVISSTISKFFKKRCSSVIMDTVFRGTSPIQTMNWRRFEVADVLMYFEF